MIQTYSDLRNRLRWLAALLGLALLLGGVAAGLHHHGDAGSHRTCAVCAAAHAPAVAVAGVSAPSSPSPAGARLVTPRTHTPRPAAPSATQSRAPPLA